MSDKTEQIPDSEVVLLKADAAVLAGRGHWRYTGVTRPEFAEPCGPDQESVWDYPRPPRLEPMDNLVEVRWQGELVARSRRAARVCETAGAPTWYIPPEDTNSELLHYNGGQSLCEWKGIAQGFAVGSVMEAGWRYTHVFPEFAALSHWCAFYPARVDCFVNHEPVQAQPGGYYGGWVTRNLVGPIKGAAGSSGW